MNLDIDLTAFMKIDSKWIMGLNVKQKAIEFLEDNMEENLDDFGDVFLDTAPKPQSIREKIDKLDFINIRNFCSTKDTVKRMER